MANFTTQGDTVHVTAKLVQPIAAKDVGETLAKLAVGQPANGVISVGGPNTYPLSEIIAKHLSDIKDPRKVLFISF